MLMINLKKEWKLLLDICASTVTGNDVNINAEELNGIDLKALIKESMYQGVPLAFFSGSEKLKSITSIEDFNYWLGVVAPYLSSNAKNIEVQKELIDILESANCPYVILKGTSVAKDYSSPSLRALGDVDFLVEEQNADRIKDFFV